MEIPDKARIEFKDYEEKHNQEYRVQFNPTELTFQVSAAVETKESELPAGKKNFQICKGKGQEAPRQIQAEMPRAMDVTMTLKLTVDTSLDKEQSVREDVESFLSSVRNPLYKCVTFGWNRLQFSGELENVSAEYVMFHPDGKPCRAYITLSIRHKGEKSGTPLWEKEYKKLFGG